MQGLKDRKTSIIIVEHKYRVAWPNVEPTQETEFSRAFPPRADDAHQFTFCRKHVDAIGPAICDQYFTPGIGLDIRNRTEEQCVSLRTVTQPKQLLKFSAQVAVLCFSTAPAVRAGTHPENCAAERYLDVELCWLGHSQVHSLAGAAPPQRNRSAALNRIHPVYTDAGLSKER